jgi:hypothetical protein
MLRSYWSQELQIAFEQMYPVPADETRKQKNKRQLQMTRWQTKTVQSTWKEMIRNNKQHGINKENRETARCGVLYYTLEDIYAHRHQYPQ